MAAGGSAAESVPGFALEQVLGSGGFATVYRARRLSDGEIVALKIAAHGGRATAALADEALALAAVGGLAAPPLLGEGRLSDGRPFVAVKFIAGTTLAELRRLAPGAWPLPRVLSLGVPLAAALGRMHARGLVHRDVKPSNVLIADPAAGSPPHTHREAWLLDLGLACRAGYHDGPPLAGVGTLPYTAPEQEVGRLPPDPRADVYALGVVLFDLVTGGPPFSATADAGRVPAPFARRMGLPLPLEALLCRCVSRSPDLRPANGDVVAAALDRLHPRR